RRGRSANCWWHRTSSALECSECGTLLGDPRAAGVESFSGKSCTRNGAIEMAKNKIAAKAGLPASRARADEALHFIKTDKRPPIVLTGARGCRANDPTGREYLHFLA